MNYTSFQLFFVSTACKHWRVHWRSFVWKSWRSSHQVSQSVVFLVFCLLCVSYPHANWHHLGQVFPTWAKGHVLGTPGLWPAAANQVACLGAWPENLFLSKRKLFQSLICFKHWFFSTAYLIHAFFTFVLSVFCALNLHDAKFWPSTERPETEKNGVFGVRIGVRRPPPHSRGVQIAIYLHYGRFYARYSPRTSETWGGLSAKRTRLDRGGVWKKSVFARTSLMDDP